MLFWFAFFFLFPFFFPHYWFHIIKKLEDGAGWLQQWTNHEAGAGLGHAWARGLHWDARMLGHAPHQDLRPPPGAHPQRPASSWLFHASLQWMVFLADSTFFFLYLIWHSGISLPCPGPLVPPEQTLVSAIHKAISSPNTARWK